MAYGDFKDLTRTASDKLLCDKAFNIARSLKYDGYQRGFASIVYKFFDEKSAKHSGATMLANKFAFKSAIEQNQQQLAKKLHKQIIIRKVYSSFKDNIWGAALDIFSKYACVVPLKDKKGITINNAFQKNLDESECKPNKIWVDNGSEFYNKSMKYWLQDNNIEMYSTHNEGLLKDLLEL